MTYETKVKLTKASNIGIKVNAVIFILMAAWVKSDLSKILCVIMAVLCIAWAVNEELKYKKQLRDYELYLKKLEAWNEANSKRTIQRESTVVE